MNNNFIWIDWKMTGIHKDDKNAILQKFKPNLKKLIDKNFATKSNYSRKKCLPLSLRKVNRALVAAMPNNGPRISGGESVYHVGDRVQVNCTSDKSHPAAELRWYINGQQVKRT